MIYIKKGDRETILSSEPIDNPTISLTMEEVEKIINLEITNLSEFRGEQARIRKNKLGYYKFNKSSI